MYREALLFGRQGDRNKRTVPLNPYVFRLRSSPGKHTGFCICFVFNIYHPSRPCRRTSERRHRQRKICLDQTFFGGFAQDQFGRHVSDPILAAYVRDPSQQKLCGDPSHALCMNVYGRQGRGMEARFR